MMRCALVDLDTGQVENIIMAAPVQDPAPDGYVIIGLLDDDKVAMGWHWDGTTFIEPSPSPEPQSVQESYQPGGSR